MNWSLFIQFLAFGIIMQIIVTIIHFKKFHEKEMLEKKYKGSATFNTMFKRFLTGRWIESLCMLILTAVGTAGLSLPALYNQIQDIMKLIPGMPEVSTELFVLGNIAFFVWKGKLWFLKFFDTLPSRTKYRGTKTDA